MRIALLIIALVATPALAIETRPSERTSAAVFKGEVISVQMVQALTNRITNAELYAARIKVTSVTKQDTKLESEVTAYYVYYQGQVCPRCVELGAKQKATFYCKRADIGGRSQVLYIPMALWVVVDK